MCRIQKGGAEAVQGCGWGNWSIISIHAIFKALRFFAFGAIKLY
jgi:hypothetical protein